MAFNLGVLTIKSVIVHQVPRKGEGEPLLSEIESPLDTDLRVYMKRKIIGSAASSYSYPISFDDEAESPVPTLINEYLRNPRTGFVEKSCKMATYLAEIQTRLNSEGLLTVVDCEIENCRGMTILKLERESGVRIDQQTIHGKRTLMIERVSELMLTNATKVFKAGVFVLKGDDIEALASDTQALDVAYFFRSTFLGCKLVQEPEIATKEFLEASEEFINEHVVDPRSKAQYHMALLSELLSNRAQVRPNAFARDHFGAEADDFVSYLRERGMDRAFAKDTQLVAAKLAKLQVLFESGAVLITPTSAIEERKVEITTGANNTARVVINDRVSSMRGAGRGKRKKKNEQSD